MKKVLFVCLGNICRSPAAEGIFRKKIEEAGLADLVEIDSAGTSAYHAGEPADARMMDFAKRRGYDLTSRSRMFNAPADFEKFDYILTMDESNLSDVHELDVTLQYGKKVMPMVEFCRIHKVPHVPDPYYQGDVGFEWVLDILEDACTQLVNRIQEDLGSR